jgi:protein-disulfide isomerase
MTQYLDRVISATLGLAAIAIAVVLVHREFFPPPVVAAGRQPSEYVGDWRDITKVGRVIGNPAARIQLIEFADLECPFCATFNKYVNAVRRAYPNDVAYVFVHYPLSSIHRLAQPAARAAECANRTGQFAQMVDGIYSKQDSLGLKPWTSYAREAGVQDTAAFSRCISAPPIPSIIDSGAALAKRMGFTGTPTVILNGWRYGYTPADTEMNRAIGDILAGRRPYEHFPKVQ